MSGRLFAIGDIHGCAPELETLLAAVPLAAGDTLVCLGDYCDRGTETPQVIDALVEVARRDGLTTVFLRGNHEDMLLAHLGRDGHYGDAWIANGGDATVRSYGLDPHAPPAEILAALPAAHLAFFERTQLLHQTPTHLLVHAGVDPHLPLAAQDSEDLLWIREPFLNAHHALPQTVVFGHTPAREVHVDLPYKIGIDTGCVYGGALTCLSATEGWVWQVSRGARTARESSIEEAAQRRRRRS